MHACDISPSAYQLRPEAAVLVALSIGLSIGLLAFHVVGEVLGFRGFQAIIVGAEKCHSECGKRGRAEEQ